MRPHIILRYVGFILVINAIFLVVSAIISVIYGDAAFRPLLYSASIALFFGVFPLVFVPPPTEISDNEGLIIVVSGWLLSCLAGTLPYVLWGGEFTFTNAWFESVSGYTTTGSSILTNIEALPHGLLFWRAATHWIGGVGIIMFALAVLPSMGIASMILFQTEMSPLAKKNFHQNARSTLRILMTVYVGLTLAETIALFVSGMNLFDAVTHSFATIATGGFSPKNTSIAFYDNVGMEIVILVFMILSGVHFGLLFSTITKRSAAIWKSTIVRYYLIALTVGVLLTMISTHGVQFARWLDALRYSAFQIISIGTSTGFANADSSVWPAFSQILLMIFALQCACAGSTSGGIKADRILLFGKAVVKQIRQMRHPNAIIYVWIDGESIHDDVLAMGLLYICVYLVTVLIGAMLLIALGVDALSAFSGVVATTGNVGPGLGSVGSTGSFSHIPALGKWILTGTMLIGRLEIYGFLTFFLPYVWRTGGVRRRGGT
ncbi:MAG: potassium transporter TrkG [Candidatus Latescibacterota bacterium]